MLQSQISVVFTGGTAQLGETFDVDVSFNDFTDLVSFQFSVNWDPNVLTFSSIENVTDQLEEFSAAGSFATPGGDAVAIDPGELTVSWSLNSTDSRTLEDGTVVFTIRFTATGSECATTEVVLSEVPRQIEVANPDFVDIGATSSSSTVSIDGVDCDSMTGGGTGGGGTGDGGTGGGGTGGGTGDGGTGGGTGDGGTGGGTGGGGASFPDCDSSCDGESGVILAVDCLGADASGTNICVPVRADNFTNTASLQTGVTWDPAQLAFTGINEIGISGITDNDTEAVSYTHLTLPTICRV